jgi:LysR family transcriptional regulator for bpeEF and oprC
VGAGHLGQGKRLVDVGLPAFLDRHPDLRLHLTLRDTLVDPIAEGLDVVVRMGHLGDSTLIARRLGETRVVLAASRAYLRKHGTPRIPADLRQHRCLGYLREGRPSAYRFETADAVEIAGPCHANDADVLRQMGLAGKGVVALFDFIVADDLARGALVPVLTEHRSEAWPVHALYPKNRHLVPKVGVFLDFLGTLHRRAVRRP